MISILTNIKQIITISKTDASLSQAIARITISIFFLILASALYDNPAYKTMIPITSVYFFYAIISLYMEYKHPQNSAKRKISNMVADFGAQSIFIYTSGLESIFVYPFILWVVMGNGIRFGSKYLYIALGISVTFFSLATQFNTVWQTHQEFVFSMTLGLIVLTLFYSTLIKKIHNLNATLEIKVKERTAQLKYRLYHDPLTKLRNRIALKSDLKKEPFVALFLIDIDKFRNFNDLYGMEIGNTVLLESVKYLKNLYSSEDIELYRIYGDGFVLRVKNSEQNQPLNTDNLSIISSMAQHTSFSTMIPAVDEKLNIDFTIVAVYQKKKALEKADMGLKYARKNNKQYIDYEDKMDSKKEIENIMQWKNRIKDAINEDRVIPVFQPIVDQNGKIIKYESLMRLDQEGKLISPYFFLDIAIKTNQYEKLTNIMVEKSFNYMREVGKDFSINLSFADIKNDYFVNQLFDKIQKYRIGSQLIIEIVESEDVQDFIIVQTFVKNIKKLGVRIAIDDFGSGYSNYAHILKIMPDYLKIDGSLIKDIDKDNTAYKLVESIVFMSQKLGIKTIAEYVHSKEVFEVTKKLQVDEFQGFYFSEPLPIEELQILTAPELST